MKFKILYFILCYFSFFAFAKVSFAAVPIQAKPLKIEIAQDSILMYESDFLIQQDNAKKETNKLFRRARILSNLSFVTIPLAVIIAILTEYSGFFELSLILVSMPILLGFTLSVIAISKLLKVRKLFDQFSALEQDEDIQEKWTKSLARSILANGLFSGLVVLMIVALSFDFFESNINPTVLLASIALTLLGIFDRIFFNIKKKVNK
jgi:hypothetical protein